MDIRRSLLIFVLVLLFIVGLGGIFWANYHFAKHNPGGNDFLPRWVGTRMYILKGRSPYSPATTLEIQKRVYGRAAQPGDDWQLFVYPFYSMLVFGPFALIEDYTLARALWMTTLEIALFLMAILSLRITRWKLPLYSLAFYFLFSIMWYHAVRPVINGNAAVLCALFIVAAFWFIRSRKDDVAGILLAFATIKPQMVVLLIPFILLWAFSHRRWNLILGLLGSLLALVLGSTLLKSDWILQNLRQIVTYPLYTLPGTPVAIFSEWWPYLGVKVGWALTVILTVILLREWWAAMGKDYRWFLWTAALTLVITNLIGIRTTTANYIALFPALVLVLSSWEMRLGRVGHWLGMAIMLVLLVGLWWLFIETIQVSAQPEQHPIMFFPLPLFLFIGLYWVRWWAIRHKDLSLEEMRAY